MAENTVAYFKNDAGLQKIGVGVRRFKCLGASAPFDHPHIFLDMGDDDEIVCPYCSTLYVYQRELGPRETNPPGCVADPRA